MSLLGNGIMDTYVPIVTVILLRQLFLAISIHSFENQETF